MSVKESIIKNSVSGSKTIFKNEIGEKEYSSICGSSEFFIDNIRSEKSCKKCGLVLEENIIDSTFRGTARDKEGNFKGQNGAPNDITIHDGGLSTTFDINKGNIKDYAKWKRLKRLHNQSRVGGTRDRNLSRAFTELGLVISKLALSSSVKRESASIYRKALDKDLIRGRSISKLLVATVYISCRLCKVPRTLDEIEKGTGINQKTISKNYRFLARELGIKLKPTSPTDYISRFASKLNLSGEVQAKAIEIINQFIGSGLSSGKGPSSIAAAALYIASILSGDRRTQSEIAQISGVTEVTIRNRYKELSEQLDSVI